VAVAPLLRGIEGLMHRRRQAPEGGVRLGHIAVGQQDEHEQEREAAERIPEDADKRAFAAVVAEWDVERAPGGLQGNRTTLTAISTKMIPTHSGILDGSGIPKTVPLITRQMMAATPSRQTTPLSSERKEIAKTCAGRRRRIVAPMRVPVFAAIGPHSGPCRA